MAEQAHEAAQPVELGAEAGVAGPIPGEAGRREADHDHPRVAVHELALADPEAVQRGRLEVLDEDVRHLDQAHEELAGLGPTGVEGARELVAGQRVVHGVAVVGAVRPPRQGRPVHGEEAAQLHAGRVGPRDVALGRGGEHRRVLDPDDLGPEVGQQEGEVGARPHGREVEHPDAVEGRRRRGRAGAARRAGCGRRRRDRTVGRRRAAGLGSGPVQAPPALGVAVGGTGQKEGTRGPRRLGPVSPLVEMVGLEDLGHREHVGERPARRAGRPRSARRADGRRATGRARRRGSPWSRGGRRRRAGRTPR